MADDSALVLVGPDDTVDTVVQKVRDAGTRSVELLVAEGVAALQGAGGFARLRTAAAEQNTNLLVITSDEKVLNAARLSQIDTVRVQGTTVVAQPKLAAPIDPYSTRPLPVADLGSDDDVLRALDDDTRPHRRLPPSEAAPNSDDEILAALDDLSAFGNDSDQSRTGRDRRTPVLNDQDAQYAAELDDWGDLSAGDDVRTDDTVRQGVAPTPEAPPARRFRPEDMELTNDDIERADRRERERTGRPAARRTSSAAADAARRRRTAFDDEQIEVAPKRRSSPLVIWLPIVLILVLLAAGAYWLYTSRATVVIKPPAAVTEEVPFQDVVMPLSHDPVDGESPAVQAVDVRSDVAYSAKGSVAGETVAPRNFAKGVVTVLNSSSTGLDLPQGTEFIATNSQGAEARFVTDAAVTVPPSTTSDNGAQIVTQRGQAQVNVTARQAGSAANVEANTIKQIAFPGQAPVAATTGGILVQNEPLTGGDEQPVRVVTDNDVQLVLQQALTGLYEQSLKTLGDQAHTAGATWKVEQTTISPRPEDLSHIGDGQVFDLAISPEIGQEVAVDNPTFTVTVKSSFNALAVPDGKALPDQLANAVPRQLVLGGTLKPGLAPTINGWHWDGSRLLVSGVLKPEGGTNTIDAATRTTILESLRGKSRADAVAILDDYKQKGLISDYQLPDRDQLPSLSFQLDLRVE